MTQDPFFQKRLQASKRRARLYKLDDEPFQKMYEDQGGKCAVCRVPGAKGFPCVDHCHKTSAVRGLLCAACNFALGALRDDEANLVRALNYLRAHRVDPEIDTNWLLFMGDSAVRDYLYRNQVGQKDLK